MCSKASNLESADDVSAVEISADEMSADEMSADEMSADAVSAVEVSASMTVLDVDSCEDFKYGLLWWADDPRDRFGGGRHSGSSKLGIARFLRVGGLTDNFVPRRSLKINLYCFIFYLKRWNLLYILHNKLDITNN